MTKYGGALFFAGVLALTGCSGSTGSDGANGVNGTNGTNGINGTNGMNGTNASLPGASSAQIEACEACHGDSGSRHQDLYQVFLNGLDPTKTQLSASIDDVKTDGTNADGTFTSTVTFTVLKNGQPIDLLTLQQKTLYATEFKTGGFVYATNYSYDLKTAQPTNAPGQYTVTNAAAKFDLANSTSAFLYGYFGDELLLPVKGHYNLMKNVISVAKPFGAVAYTSSANVSGCEKCHPAPYSKHGYRQATVAGLNDFVACKACHTDQRPGTDFDWQVMADDAPTYATLSASGTATVDWKTGAALTTANKYKYVAKVMNDTHMSHAMEFGYPQSMANCVTCHEGKLGQILTDPNFTLETCKSCHPLTGTGADPKRAPALKPIMTATPAIAAYHGMDLYTFTGNCNSCHKAGGIGPTFDQIHSGYDSQIYASDAAKTKYFDAVKVTIDSATYASKTYSLDVKFSANQAVDVGLDVTKIVPTVLLSLYGYDTKDFIVSAHGKDATGKRLLEFPIDGTTTNPRFTVVTSPAGSWEVKVDLSMWKDMIAAGQVKRVEIGVMPTLKNASGVVLPINAPSRTFNLSLNGFTDGYFAQIVDPAKCNKCHDALATTFHSPDRGGNVVVCRLCHTTQTGAGHIEMASRSIDSYVHAIHSSQMMGIDGINFADPVAALGYNLKVEETYPNFSLLSCESCHNPGTYEVPRNTFSLPTILSASATLNGWARNISGIPESVVGPGSRACGSCHRSAMITEDSADGLATVNTHLMTYGYMVPTNGDANGAYNAAIEKIFSAF